MRRKPQWLRVRKGRYRARMDVYERHKHFPYFRVIAIKSRLLDTIEEAREVAGTLSRQHRQLGEIWQGRTFVCNVNGMSRDFEAKRPDAFRKDAPLLYTLDDEMAMEHDIRTAMACLYGEPDSDVCTEQDVDYVDLVHDPVIC